VQEQVGEHSLWHLPLPGILSTVHADTVMTTWVAMILVLPVLWWIGSSYRSAFVGRSQTVTEGMVNYFADLAYGSMGKRAEPFVPFFIALVVFIFVLNEFGVFPFKVLGLPFGGSPTADLNTCLAYAVMVFVIIQVSGIRKEGFGFYKHLFKPFWPMVIINIPEEILRPTTLALRLFFNIFIGELLLFVVVQIISSHVSVGPVNLSLAAAIVGPFAIQIFNFLIGALQAFVFVLLSIVYLSLALSDDH
jgi:F-type H+-transporting ATPase subunit a